MPFNDSRIEHFVVLMLENRSFDHMLGFSGIPGIDGLTGAETNPDTTGAPVKVSNDAQYIGDYEPDPGHELFDVNVQIFSNQLATPGTAPPMQGFIQSYFQVCADPNRARTVLKCFSPQTVPNLTYLARNYAVCDRWFSSVPGPTLPNRSFAHAATSLGSAVGPPYLGDLHTIYPVLNQQVSAKIYYQDFTMALTFKELLSDQTKYFGVFNDFLTDWCSADPARLVPITALPFWDLDLALAELDRCLALGHRALNFCNQPQEYGQPPLAHRHWDPIWARAQEAGVPISFHVGGGSMGTQFTDTADMGWMTNFAKVSSLIIMDNMRCLGDLIFGGVCHRFPDLRMVSVESGVGWIPGVLETFDWQWRNGGVHLEHPDYDLLPSEYFRRQLFGCFWFEQEAAIQAITLFPDNILYETDYPHPTCQHPGPASPAQRPRDYASALLGDQDPAVVSKVLHDNAARLYGLA